jgi:photosystem II stability/assembly factor-like uncharacterized protein
MLLRIRSSSLLGLLVGAVVLVLALASSPVSAAVGHAPDLAGGAGSGGAWRIVPAPRGFDPSDLSCGAEGFCVATPNTTTSVQVTSDFGKTWTARPVPDGVGVATVSCGSDSSCVAAGNQGSNQGYATYFALTGNRGATWSPVAAAGTPPFTGAWVIQWTSCSDGRHCVAAGYNQGDLFEPIALGWSSDGGRTWRDSTLPFNPAIGQAVLSCVSASTCFMAYGGYDQMLGGDFPTQVLVSQDGGAHWAQRGNSLTGLNFAEGVACPSANSCVVVGDKNYYGGLPAQGAAWWTSDGGKHWQPSGLGGSYTDLASVACTSTSDCWAIGTSGSGVGQRSVILGTNDGGRSWDVAMSSAGPEFVAISCTSGSCLAVGKGEIARMLSPMAAIAPIPDGQGYYTASIDGGVLSNGKATGEGDLSRAPLASRVVGMAVTPSGNGYWVVTGGGGVYPFGDARSYGSEAGKHLARPIVGMALTKDDKGYYLVASDGGLFAFGDARFQGSMGGKHLNAPIVGIGVDDATGGYWMVAADGGIFAFHAHFYGSAGSLHLAKPIVGIAALAAGTGYRFVASDGGVFDYGAARYYGSLGGHQLSSLVRGMASNPAGPGYWLMQADGTVTGFGGVHA